MQVRLAPPGGDLEALGAWAEVVIAPAGVLYMWPALAQAPVVKVFDLYDPYHLENLTTGNGGVAERQAHFDLFSDAITAHLVCGDFFVCASERQRDFWLGALSAARRLDVATYDVDPELRELVDVVPFGVDPGPPRRGAAGGGGIKGQVPGVAAGDEVVLWAGGVYNWLDPVSAILAVDRLRVRRPGLRLVFLGTSHPNPVVPAMRTLAEARELSARLGIAGRHVIFNEGWVPFEQRGDFLLDADVGISTHHGHVETRFAFRTRVLDYLWARRPMVLTGGDVLSEAAARAGVARVVAPGDVPALCAAIDATLDEQVDPSAFEPLVEPLRWEAVVRPLARFLAGEGPERVTAGRASRAGGR